jgi:RHS repeat-associated protein
MKTNNKQTRFYGVFLAVLLLTQAAYAFYNTATGRWLNRDPAGEPGGTDLYAYCDNRPVDSLDANGLFGCSAPRTCYCCCVDNITTNPDPPKAIYVPYTPPSFRNSWNGVDGSYNVPFSVVVSLSYLHAANATDRECKIQWLETWYPPTSMPPWYAPDFQYGKPYDRTRTIGRFPPASSCDTSPTVRFPDEPGNRFITPNSSWTMNLKIEVIVTSGADPYCQQICQYGRRKLTLTIQLKMVGGKPVTAYENVVSRTE